MKKMLLILCMATLSILNATGIDEITQKCAMNDGDSCATMGALYSGLGEKYGIPKDLKKSESFYKKGCDLKSGSACTSYANFFKNIENRIKILKKACDFGNENGCLSYNSIIYLSKLQNECDDKKPNSCRLLGGEIFLGGTFHEGKSVLNLACSLGDEKSCKDIKIIETQDIFSNLTFVEETNKKCVAKKDKYACDKLGFFFFNSSSLLENSHKTDIQTRKLTNIFMAKAYFEKACKLGRKESCKQASYIEELIHGK